MAVVWIEQNYVGEELTDPSSNQILNNWQLIFILMIITELETGTEVALQEVVVQ